MNDIQYQYIQRCVEELKKRPQCALIALHGEVARNEGDDFSTIELLVVMDRVGMVDLLHTREQFLAQCGPVLSFLYGDEVFEAVYDDELEYLRVRLHVVEEGQEPESMADFAQVGYEMLYVRPGYTYDIPAPEPMDHDEEKHLTEQRIVAAWHQMYTVIRSVRRERVAEGVAAYLELIEDIVELLRVLDAPHTVGKGLFEWSIDGSEPHVRAIESLLCDVRFGILEELVSSAADLLEETSAQLHKKKRYSIPSKTRVRHLRKGLMSE